VARQSLEPRPANATVTIKLTVDQAEFTRNVLNRYIAQMAADARALPGLDDAFEREGMRAYRIVGLIIKARSKNQP
jgi:hypothetical protein